MTPPEPAVFAEPWEARAFALAVALVDAGAFTSAEWAAALGAALAAAGEDDGGGYYAACLAAVEGLAVAKGLTALPEMATRKADWARAYRSTPHGRPVTLEDQTFGDPDPPAGGSHRHGPPEPVIFSMPSSRPDGRPPIVSG